MPHSRVTVPVFMQLSGMTTNLVLMGSMFTKFCLKERVKFDVKL